MLYYFYYFFFTTTATTHIYTLSLHDALPISTTSTSRGFSTLMARSREMLLRTSWSAALSLTLRTTRIPESKLLDGTTKDRKSTRLNSSHVAISYAVFCLKKKKTSTNTNSVHY